MSQSSQPARWLPFVVLGIGLVAISLSAIFARLAQAEGVSSLAVATWRLGLAALVGGGLAAKTGLLAKLGLFLAKFWKLLVFGGIGLAAVIGKLRGKKADGTVN